MILVAVGTFIHGFDALVQAADEAAAALAAPGFAQIGHSAVVPRHLAWARFLPPEALAQHMAAAKVVVCHGGIGLLGEAMRADKPILVLPRRGRPTRTSPAGDQTELVHRLAQRHPIRVCERSDDLGPMLAELWSGPPVRRYALGSDVPALIADFLATSAGHSRPT